MNESVIPGFIHFANRLAPLGAQAEADLSAQLCTKSFLKGDCILKEGEVCRHLYFVDEGLVKLFFSNEEKAFIMRFFPDGSLFTLLDSYLTQSPARYEIRALENSSLTMIRYDALEDLCRKHHSIETFFRKLVSMAAVNMMGRVSEMLEEDASARYAHFVEDHPALLQRISLGDLAGYLGITPVSLSRIRAKR